MARTPLANKLPDFPWDSLTAAKEKAAAHPDGIVNLSVGTPVDDVAPSIQLALAENAARPGYPQTQGLPELREAIASWLSRRYNVSHVEAKGVLPVIGTKEAIAWLPTLLGMGSDSVVVIPEVAYPTYEVGGILAGATVVRSDAPQSIGDDAPDLVFLNSPSNPTGAVLSIEDLQAMVEYAREHDCIVVSDECYIGLGWEKEPISLLDDRVTGGDLRNLLVMNSLSKSSNLASYRAGFLAGDPRLVQELLEVRKHSGLMMPGPMQHAMVAALEDDEQEQLQKLRYAHRRAVLLPALIRAGFTVDSSEAGLYLWATRGEDCRATVDWLAELGILAAPGDFYGPQGQQHVRVALTATDERIAAAAERLAAAAE